jgi:gliding motility-associated-like protein
MKICQDVDNNIVVFQVDPDVNPGATYQWSIPAQFQQAGGGTSDDFFVLLKFNNLVASPGLPISVTQFKNGACGGSVQAISIIVDGPPAAPLIVGENIACAESTETYTVISPNDGSAYHWQIPSGASIEGDIDSAEITMMLGITGGNIFVQEITEAGCASPLSAPFQITVNEKPLAISLDRVVVADDEEDNTSTQNLTLLQPVISNTPGVTFTWYDGPDLLHAINDLTLQHYVVSSSTNLSVAVRKDLCTSVANVRFTVTPNVSGNFFVSPMASCYPVALKVKNNWLDNAAFEWTLIENDQGIVAEATGFEPIFKVAKPGLYKLMLTGKQSSTGLIFHDEIDGIEVFDKPIVSFNPRQDLFFIPDSPFEPVNETIGATQYEWNFGDGGSSFELSPTYFFKTEGKFNVVLHASNDHGMKDIDGDGNLDENVVCHDLASREITAREGGSIKIPNVFTPNTSGPTGGVPGAGVNDVFLPITTGVEEFQMQVYDRWGSLVFESLDKNLGWDGYGKNGSLLPTGVYVYKLTIRLSNGGRTTRVGDITLLR